jgi:sialate O-acetylesterase
VGLVNSSVGGTPIEAWIDADAQAATPALAAAVAAERQADAAFDEPRAREQHERAVAAWRERAAAAQRAGEKPPQKPRDPLAQRANRRPGSLFNGKIAPLVPFAIRGVVWYQGEANTRPGAGPHYRHQLPLLMADWRRRWGDELPFAWVQLPNFGRDGAGWMLVREAMLTSLAVPKTGMAITIDVGESLDIHPRNKQDVGRRLAAWALADVYGRTVPARSGPLPAGSEIRGGEIVCRFTEADGLADRDGGDVDGFVIAGADGRWRPARARIDGTSVVVSAADVPGPAAVRYGWAPDPKCDLVNAAGLPASPFRTDDWPVDWPVEERPTENAGDRGKRR